ncbi:hypothetical protein BGW39_000864 [Mortierella sp. 14UC]|nr:hypothetical protein BGW39_000864 [Mortierella sp. 14UC]
MDSGHGSRGSKAGPMRVAAMRPTDSEFRVAEREDGGKAPQYHEAFNAPAHLLHRPMQSLAPSQPLPSLKVASAPKPTPSKASQSSHAHNDPLNAPAHLIHASSAAKPAPVQALKPKAATPMQQPAAPKQNHRQFQPGNIYHSAHPIPEKEIAQQQHAENRQGGNSHGHHTYAVPAHHDHEIPFHPENEDPMDHHNHYRHQYEGIHQLQPNSSNDNSVDSPMLNLGSLFSSANVSGLGDYTYSDAVTHMRHHAHHASAAHKSSPPRDVATTEMNLGSLFAENESQSRPKAHRAEPSQPREQVGRSYGHHDLEYDIEGSSNHHRHQDQPLLPTAWFKEPAQNAILIHIARGTLADSAPEDPAERRHQENRQRGNSHCHHAHTVPAHRDHRPHHQHEYDATDKHNHFRYQPHDQNCGEHHDNFGNMLPTAAGDSPLISLAHLFSAASSGLSDYTYAEAAAHKRHAHPAPALKKHRRAIHKPQPSLRSRQHLGRSYGHHGHHPQYDLNPVERSKYDIVGLPRQLHHKAREQFILPGAWFTESLLIYIASQAAAPAASMSPEDEAVARRHLENKRRGNSHSHHAHAVPAHRLCKPYHNHDNDDTTDNHNHCRPQPHDENCGTDHHDDLGFLRVSAASDSPRLTLRKMFSAANSSCFGDYTCAEAVSHKHHSHAPIHAASSAAAPKSHQNNAATPEMNLGALFTETDSAPSHQHEYHHGSHEHHERSFGHHGHHPQHDVNSVEGFDYDIEGYQHHPNEQEEQQQAPTNPAPNNHQTDEDAVIPELNIDDWYPEHEPQSQSHQPTQQGNDHGPRGHHERRSFGHHSHHAQHNLNSAERFNFDIECYRDRPNAQEQKDKHNATDGFEFSPPALSPHGLRTRHSGTDLRQADPLARYRSADEYRSLLSQHRPPSSPNASHSHSHPSASNLDIRPHEIRIVLANMPSLHTSGSSTPPLQEQQKQSISKKERKQARRLQRQSARKFRKFQTKSAVTTLAPASFKLHGTMDDDVYVEAVKQHSKHHAPYPDSFDNHHSQQEEEPGVCKKKRKQALKQQRQAARKLRQKAHQKTAAPAVEPSKKDRKRTLKQLRHADRKTFQSQQKGPAPYKADGSLDDDVTTSDNGKDIKDPKYGPGHIHISEYQKQLHHFDYDDHHHHSQTNPPQSQHQTQRQQAAKTNNTAQPLAEDYYADDANANAPELPELEQLRQYAGNGHRERAGPAQ